MSESASWHARGRRHLAEGRPAEAHACLTQAAAGDPDNDTIRADLARSLYESERAAESIPIWHDLLRRAPDNADYLVNLSRASRAVGAFAEGIEYCRRALIRLPNEAVLFSNIGTYQIPLGQLDEAVANFRRAIELQPDLIPAHHNLSHALLTLGRMREGWEEFRWRLRTAPHLRDGKPMTEWDGTPMPGKILLVRAEQGFGDSIQFCRYLPLIAPKARVIAQVPRGLVRLLRGLPNVETVIAQGETPPPFDAECAMMSLPRLLDRDEAHQSGPVPYLRADPVMVRRWRERLDPLPGMKVGLVWAGSPALGHSVWQDQIRSVTLAALSALRGPTFVSLQKGAAAAQAKHPPEGMVLLDWTDDLHDFADTAALIAALDLVITVDTAVAHLAGALGCPVWMLNRIDTDWRWGVTGETTPWYPSMRLFRQTQRGDWTGPIASVATALREPQATGMTLALADADVAAGRFDNAIERLRRASRDRPGDPDIVSALARYLLFTERWIEAWPEWAATHHGSDWPTPEWDGSAMPDETLLLHADTIAEVLLFGRYMTEAGRRSGARIVLSVPTQLQRLMVGRADAAVATVARPSHHRHCAFAMLPVLFRARPNSVPDDDLCPRPPLPVIEAWSPAVTRLRGLRVGVAFDDAALLSAVAQVRGINLVRLRNGASVVDPSVVVHDWSIGFDDLAAISGLITHLDLIIAEDNEIAHLAAALGRPVWLIMPSRPRFPWTPGREDNVWYPTLRQFPVGSVASIATELALLATDTPEDQMFAYANECHRRRDYRAAATGFRQTLALKPDHAGALGNLSITMLTLGRPDTATRYAEQAVRVAPSSHPLRLRLGLALHARGRFDAAVARLREARAMDRDHADTLTALGNALGASGALEEAIGTAREAVAARPENAGYRTNLAYALLRAGHWAEGWREHEYRPERPRLNNVWDGQPLSGTPLLLRHEQGIGDIIQFCRYAPLAARRAGGAVFMTAPASLRNLLRGLPGVSVLTGDEPPPPDARQFPLLSLPLLFNTTEETIPAPIPYLHADPARVARWRDRISASPAPRIGLVWAGNPRLGTASLAGTDRRRSLPENTLAPLATIPGVTFVSLQVGDAMSQGVKTLDWSGELTDFAETAALIMTLDLVISVDTAVAHLAGALGKPVWLLNRFDTDWRWMDGRDDSRWYPTMRLFRQISPGDWETVIDRVVTALAKFDPAA